MAGTSLIIDDRELTRQLRTFEGRARNLTPAMKSFGEYMLLVTDERFRNEEDPQGRPWEPWAQDTLMIAYGWTKRRKDGTTHARSITRKRGGLTAGFERYAQGRNLLTLSHRLRRSITYRAGRSQLAYGTNVVYGRIHQKGGMAGRSRKVRIPMRQYLGFNPENIERFCLKVKRYLGGES